MNNSTILNHKPVIKLTLKDDKYQLFRLNDQEYYTQSENSFSICNDIFYFWKVERYFQSKNEHLTLPKIYVVLTLIAGETSKFYDDDKSSFCFPFSLKIYKQERILDNYLLILSDRRGDIEFRLQRLIGENENYTRYERQFIKEPFDDEFSREEINDLIGYLYGYFVGYFEAIQELPHNNFFKHINSNLILYGYTNGDFWEKDYENSDYYYQQLEELKLQYPT